MQSQIETIRIEQPISDNFDKREKSDRITKIECSKQFAKFTKKFHNTTPQELRPYIGDAKCKRK